jgi:type IV pilus assembly protein PilA
MVKALLFGKGQNRGFTLIELLIVILIVGILAAVAAPLYLGYVKDAKMAEGKSVAGALWTSLQANGVAGCGTTATVAGAYPRAGFTSGGVTIDGRWTSAAGGGITVDCTDGHITETGTMFTLTGSKTDVAGIKIVMSYDSTSTPPGQLLCAPDTTSTPVKC